MVRNRLGYWIKARNISVVHLAKRTGVNEQTLRGLVKHTLTRVEFDVLGRVCTELGIGISDLLVLEPDDIWSPILTSGEVTIHYGSRILPAWPAKSGQKPVSLQYIGKWDDEASRRVSEYLHQRSVDVRITYTDYLTGGDAMASADLSTIARNILRRGNHVVLGSPLANVLTEYLMCSLYDVAPFHEGSLERFPYAFEWQPERWARSAFGRPGSGVFGVRCNPGNQLVAEQSVVESGQGTDCGIICVRRHSTPLMTRDDREECVVVVLMGQGGPGTLAAAQLATDVRVAPELHPAHFDTPLSRAFRVSYDRPASTRPGDNRVVTHRELVPLPGTVTRIA